MQTLYKIYEALRHFYILAALLCLAPLTLPAAQYRDFTYTSDSTAITITRYTGPGGNVTIPDPIESLPVTTIGDSASFNAQPDQRHHPQQRHHHRGLCALYCSSLTNVTIGNSVTTIKDYAFSGAAA